MSLQRVHGSIWDTSDNIVVKVLADLPEVDKEGIVFVSGGKTPNDGSGGWFMYDPLVVRSTANATDTIDPTGTGVGKGCWARQMYFTAPAGSSFSEVQTAAANQQEFTLQTFTYRPTKGEIAIYVNGQRLVSTSVPGGGSYSETGPNKVTMAYPLRLGDIVEFIKYEQPVGAQGPVVKAMQIQYEAARTETNLTQGNVQEAIEELEQIVAVAAGGAIPTAANITYAAQFPDVSPNVQQGMRWLDDRQRNHLAGTAGRHSADQINYDDSNTNLNAVNAQQAIEEILNRLGHGLAKDIGFDNTNISDSRIPADNLQDLGDQLYTFTKSVEDEVNSHKSMVHKAHEASAISFDGVNTSFDFLHTAGNVDQAIMGLASELEFGDIGADQITVDNSPPYADLGGTVQRALELDYDRFIQHTVTDPVTHNADTIAYTPRQGKALRTSLETHRLGAHVQTAIESLEDLLDEHDKSNAAHDASDLSFKPQQGIQANTIEAALNFINSGNWRYKGHLDITAGAVPAQMSRTLNDFYTVPYIGNVDRVWLSRFAANAGLPSPDANGDINISGDGYVLVDDAGLLWYMVMPSIQDAIVSSPTPGQSQDITTAAPGDTALMLLGVSGQTSELLYVDGDSLFIGDISVNKARDATGNLRQDAGDVLFIKPNQLAIQPRVAVTTVETALKEIYFNHVTHIAGTQGKHNAEDINFRPVTHITDTDVQNAVEKVQQNLEQHGRANSAHKAINLQFDGAHTQLTVTNIQDAIDTLYDSSVGHPGKPDDAHAATAITFNATTKLPVANVQLAIERTDTEWRTHVASTAGAHTASAISASLVGKSSTINTAQLAFDSLQAELTGHMVATASGVHNANNIAFAATGFTAGTVEQAILEVNNKMTVGLDIDGGAF